MSKTEKHLLDVCTQIGAISEMSGPATGSFAGWVESHLKGRAVESLTLSELLEHLDQWRASWRRIQAEASG